MLVPPEAHGVRCISMGFFAEEDQPVIWRGPMLHKALEQFLTDVYWDEPDFLLVDLPPGTGDIALSLAQFLPRAEVYVVTTPQPAAQQVAQRAAAMAEKVNLEVKGVIENMSWFTGDDGKRYELFGAGGGPELADRLERAAARPDAAASRAARGRRRRATRSSARRARQRGGAVFAGDRRADRRRTGAEAQRTTRRAQDHLTQDCGLGVLSWTSASVSPTAPKEVDRSSWPTTSTARAGPARSSDALADDDRVLWLTDKRGRQVGVPVAKIAYVEIGAPDARPAHRLRPS